MSKLFRFIINKIFWGFLQYIVSEKLYTKIRYWLVMGDSGNFEKPQRFTEKIQYIKFYERTELRKTVAHRIKVRDYVRSKVGEKHLIPILGIYDKFTKNDWEILPHQFVLKANHGCGMIEIVTDKSQQDFEQLHLKTVKWQKTDYYKVGREWVYKGLSREILAEKLLLDENEEIPKDWKFFCFNGEAKIIQVDFGRFSDVQTRNLYDRNFKRLDTELLYPSNNFDINKHQLLNQAIRIAEKLSEDFTFIRVDLYVTQNKIFFGELTNYPGNGFIPFKPIKMEYEIGSWLKLNI